jgi:hypothetical protein
MKSYRTINKQSPTNLWMRRSGMLVISALSSCGQTHFGSDETREAGS